MIFVAVCTCVFLASQVPQIESTSRGDDGSSSSINGDNGDLSPEHRTVRIDGYAEDNQVYFNSSRFDDRKDQYRYKIDYLACEVSMGFMNWQNIPGDWIVMRIVARPHTNVTLQIRDKTTGNIIGRNSTVAPAKAPDARVTSLHCTSKYCKATVDDDCTKYNGNNVTVHFTLHPSSDKLKNPLVTPVSSGVTTVTKGLRGLDLLPFTNYTVTASLANNAGPATDPALTKQATFITKPQRPGRASSLAVTQVTPSSLHVVWTAPDDDPPKGKLTQYKLQWMVPGLSTSVSFVSVNESVTSFNITGLQPNTTYEITISAKNAGTSGYGEDVSITSTTTEEGEADQLHINSTSGCVDDPPIRHTTTNHRPPPVVQPPPLPPPPPQVPAGSQQQQHHHHHQAITSHYGRGIDHYGRAIDAYVAHLAFLETYLTQLTV